MDKVYDFTLILQEYNYGAIGGTDLTYTSWFMLFTAVSSQVGIIILNCCALKLYCKKYFKVTPIQMFAIIWPIGFVALEESRMNHILQMGKGKKERLYKDVHFDLPTTLK